MKPIYDNAHTIVLLLGSARVARADFGVSPKRTRTVFESRNMRSEEKVRDVKRAITTTRGACATQYMI